METNFNGPSDPEKLEAGQDNIQAQTNGDSMDAGASENHEPKKRVKHEDHNVSRKYRLFSNHSSYGDSPHTNTSI
jgi:hypothetical protein